MKLVGSLPGPKGRFEKGGKSYGGPRRKHGACMVREDRPLTKAEKAARWRVKVGPEMVRAVKQRWRLANPEKYKNEKRQGHLKKYGLTPETYEAMLVAQDRKCANCLSSEPSAKRGWQIDHCHKTGMVRGILCQQCNVMIAMSRESPEILRSAIDYLCRASGITMIRAG